MRRRERHLRDGFEGALLLLNRNTNQAKSISLWSSRSAFEVPPHSPSTEPAASPQLSPSCPRPQATATTPAYREAMAALGAHFLSPPELEEWEHASSYFPPRAKEADDIS